MSKSTRTFGFAVAVTLGLTGQALAHAELKSATPPVNGTVTVAPSELDLEFTEGVNLAFTSVELKGRARRRLPPARPRSAPATIPCWSCRSPKR
jgi:methionine-rich copper-binding protein CopC